MIVPTHLLTRQLLQRFRRTHVDETVEHHVEVTRMSGKAPWRCPLMRCGAGPNEPCRTRGTYAKTKYLPQMHRARWDARPERRTT